LDEDCERSVLVGDEGGDDEDVDEGESGGEFVKVRSGGGVIGNCVGLSEVSERDTGDTGALVDGV
jgi:hypothetical protein